MAMLLEQNRCRECGLETMCGVVAYDAAKASERRAARRRLSVVRKRVQVVLNSLWRSEFSNEPPFGRGERRRRWSLTGPHQRS